MKRKGNRVMVQNLNPTVMYEMVLHQPSEPEAFGYVILKKAKSVNVL
jgi:hypothetical protein